MLNLVFYIIITPIHYGDPDQDGCMQGKISMIVEDATESESMALLERKPLPETEEPEIPQEHSITFDQCVLPV